MLINPLSLTRDLQSLDTPVGYIRRSDIHLLTARRNAWNSTMINRYSSNAPAYSTVLTALKAAELRRKPGTYFEIDELPSLVFDLDGQSLVVTHLNASPRFKSWSIPPEMTDRDSPITGREVLKMFAGSDYRDVASGWRTSNGKPDVLLGIVESSALETSFGEHPIYLRRSRTQSGGKLGISIERKHDGADAQLERIIEGLSHLTEQQYPPHDIYLWEGEYFCKKDYNKLYSSNMNQFFVRGWPVTLTETPESSTFCSTCLLWFSGAHPDNAA